MTSSGIFWYLINLKRFNLGLYAPIPSPEKNIFFFFKKKEIIHQEIESLPQTSFLIPIYFQPDGVNPGFFKFRLLCKAEFKV